MRFWSIIALSATAVALAACGSEPTGSLDDLLNFGSAQGPTTVSATKTAAGLLTKTFPWTIEKAAAVETLDLFRGDQAAVTFTVTLARGDSVNVSAVAGEVCVTNPGAHPTEGLTITDKVQYHTGDGNFQDLSGATVTITPEQQVEAGATECFPYEIPVTPQTNGVYQNVASISITNLEEGAEPASATAPFTLPDTLTGERNRAVNVQDSSGQSWAFEDSGSQTYDIPFVCDDHAGANENVVTIVETGQTAAATVTVNCYALTVAKTAVTEFTRTFGWEVMKTSDSTHLILPAGFPWDVAYTVTVDTAGYTDGDAKLSGMITIDNPAPMAAKVLGVSDMVSPDLAMTVDCQVEFPVTIDAGGTLECAYQGDLPDVAERSNTASVTLQNVSIDAAGAATEMGTTDFTGAAAVTFGDPANLLDVCASVTDDRYGDVGSACLADGLPKVFTYSLTLGAYDACGMYSETNTVSYKTSDTEATGEATWSVEVNVPCGQNCTLSHGYWKNHSEHGPAPYDDTWALLPNGADTPFFDTGLTWLFLMKEPPKGGNAYIKLARQFMAAWLNGLHGASLSAVADDVQRAMELLDEYDGNPSAYGVDDKDLQKEFNMLQGRLDEFNNGLIEPGSCEASESSTSYGELSL
ncbi:MAG: hypothetical protein IH616_05690 [Gemmatimonadales bacterium]|nr:hypothetical protein [Gemmatimonadales bacterium]